MPEAKEGLSELGHAGLSGTDGLARRPGPGQAKLNAMAEAAPVSRTAEPGPGPRARPEKGTPEYALWVAAIDIAAAAPLDQAAHAFAAKVPWSQVHELRRALEAVGIDWRSVWERENRK